MPSGYKDVHAAGTSGLRVAAKARSVAGNDAVAKVYTALGTSLHNRQERELFVADIEGHIANLLAEAGLPGEWALSANDESFDRLIADETAMALERAGKRCGHAHHYFQSWWSEGSVVLWSSHFHHSSRRRCYEIVGCHRDHCDSLRYGRTQALTTCAPKFRLIIF